MSIKDVSFWFAGRRSVSFGGVGDIIALIGAKISVPHLLLREQGWLFWCTSQVNNAGSLMRMRSIIWDNGPEILVDSIFFGYNFCVLAHA